MAWLICWAVMKTRSASGVGWLGWDMDRMTRRTTYYIDSCKGKARGWQRGIALIWLLRSADV